MRHERQLTWLAQLGRDLLYLALTVLCALILFAALTAVVGLAILVGV